MGHRPGDALVEIWNGMPFLSPLWYRGPRLVFLHHVHAEMWGMVLPPALARLGDLTERRLAPRFYRQSRVVTLSESSRAEIVDMLGLAPERVTVAPPGIDGRFSPGGQRSAGAPGGGGRPAGAGQALRRAAAGPGRGEGASSPSCGRSSSARAYERPALEALRDELGATEWVSLPGHVSDDELVSWYRQAWVVASSSQREGWGMTLTEAAACGTPGRGDGHRGPCRCGRRRRLGAAWSTTSPTWPRRWAASCATTCCAAACPRARCAVALVHLGRHGPPRARGAGRGGVAPDRALTAARPLARGALEGARRRSALSRRCRRSGGTGL